MTKLIVKKMPNQMNKSAMSMALSIFLGAASAPAPALAQSAQDGGKGWLVVALIPAVGEALKSAFSSSVGQGATCVFGNMLSFMGAKPNWNCNSDKNPQTINNVPLGNPQFNQGGMIVSGAVPANMQQSGVPSVPVPPPVISSEHAQALSIQPVLSFEIMKLASDQPNAAVDEQLAAGKFEQGNSPEFTLQTGDAFAVRFATSVPGRVRLINTDVEKVVTPSSMYEALPANDNRMPRQQEGGILMTGTAGVEYLDVEFTPCISPTYVQDPRVVGFVGKLPACGAEAATKQYSPALPGGKGGLVDFGGKAMKFPPNGNPSQPVAIAPEGYTKGEMLRFRIVINHKIKF